MTPAIRRRLLFAVSGVVALVLAAVAVQAYRDLPAAGLRVTGAGAASASPAGPSRTVSTACLALPRPIRRSATPLAVVDRGALRLIDLGACEQWTLIRSAVRSPVQVSADGAFVGFGRALVVSRSGDQVQRPLGVGVWSEPNRLTWAWAQRGDRLAGITTRGAVVAGAPGARPRMLEPPGWGATSIAFGGARTVLAVRGTRELWLLPFASGRPRLLFRTRDPAAVLQLAGVAGGAAIVWRQAYVSASTAADGDSLFRIGLADGSMRRLARSVLVAPGFVVDCGPGLAVAAGGGRDARVGKRIVVFDRGWRARSVGTGVSPSCSADGSTIAFSTGRREPSLHFGDERRRIEVVHRDGTHRMIVGSVRRGIGANDPVLSADGRVVEWVQADERRSGVPSTSGVPGVLRAALVDGSAHRTGPIADLGTTTNYYGTLGWPQTIAPAPVVRRPR